MASSATVQLTQYGYPGDPDMDTSTKAGLGGWNNKLGPISCALTNSAAAAIGAVRGNVILITLPNGSNLFRRYDDVAPETDERCDLYMPKGFNPKLPDTAVIQVNAQTA